MHFLLIPRSLLRGGFILLSLAIPSTQEGVRRMVSHLCVLCLGLGMLSTVMGCAVTPPPPMAPLRATLPPVAPSAVTPPVLPPPADLPPAVIPPPYIHPPYTP